MITSFVFSITENTTDGEISVSNNLLELSVVERCERLYVNTSSYETTSMSVPYKDRGHIIHKHNTPAITSKFL